MPRLIKPSPDWTEPVENPTTFLDACANLQHTLDVFERDGVEDDCLILTATTNIYGPGITTGLTFGDLRLLAWGIRALRGTVDK